MMLALIYSMLFLTVCADCTHSLKYTWASDLHLDQATTEATDRWLDSVRQEDSCGLFVCGDIAEDGSTAERIINLYHEIERPIFFILGNHDFYGGSIHKRRAEIARLLKEPLIKYSF